VLIGLRGDGSPEKTQAFFLDTDPDPRKRSPDSEPVEKLQDKLAELAIGDSAGGGSFRAQVVHL
jgi:hypothetical protein